MQPKKTGRRLPAWVWNADPYDSAAALLLIGVAVLVILTFRDYAVSNDEEVQQRYGELIIAYYASGFTDRTVFSFKDLYLYGGLFDILTTLIAKVVPVDVYSIRHVLCAATGIAGIAATWATARLVAGPRAGLIAALVLALCGPWYGGMFNHTKDITFAAAMMGATYMLLRVARELPHPRLRDVIFFGLLLGAALGLRAMGLLLLAYVGLAIVLQIATRGMTANRNTLGFIGRSLLALAPALLIGYAIMIATWPWSALDPFNPVRAIFTFNDFHYPIRTLLAGDVYEMADVPRWYVPAYLVVKLPLIMLAGLALAALFAAVPRLSRQTLQPQARDDIAFLAVAALLPVMSHVIGHGPAFTGLRHFLFVVPPLAVLAAIGCDALMTRLGHWRRSAAVAAGA